MLALHLYCHGGSFVQGVDLMLRIWFQCRPRHISDVNVATNWFISLFLKFDPDAVLVGKLLQLTVNYNYSWLVNGF